MISANTPNARRRAVERAVAQSAARRATMDAYIAQRLAAAIVAVASKP